MSIFKKSLETFSLKYSNKYTSITFINLQAQVVKTSEYFTYDTMTCTKAQCKYHH